MWIGTGRSLSIRIGSVLAVPDLEQILDFCGEQPVERVFLEDAARRGLGRFAGVADEDGRLTALCHVGANVVPAGAGCAVFAAATLRGHARMIIGAEDAVAELWDVIAGRMPEPRDDRPGQPVYALDEPPEPGETGLRAATIDDLDLLLPACAAAHSEEIGIDPIARDPEGFRWRTRSQIEEGRSWLWIEDGTILFKAEASAWTPSAVQVQQVWVDPAVRRRGNAQRGMRDLCRLLLERVPTVCLFVRPENAPAIRVYDAIGMRRVLTYRSLIF
jgi:ribosomal protein S18 acetylase RimI-like enzyme